jgi:hypothetical protein
MQGPPTDDAAVIQQMADEYFGLADNLDEKRQEQKTVTRSKTKWRKRSIAARVDAVVLADAAEFKRKLELDPDKTTREWRLFLQYAKAIGAFELLVPGLFDKFEVRVAEEAA